MKWWQNKHNGRFSLGDHETVMPNGKNKKSDGKEREREKKKHINLSQNPETVHSVKSSCCIFGFVNQTTLGKGAGIKGSWVFTYIGA